MECGFLIQRWGYEGMAGTEEGRSHGAARPKPRALSWRFQESRTSCELERAVDREVDVEFCLIHLEYTSH